MEAFYEFEKPIVSLEKKLTDLKELSKSEGMNFKTEIQSLEKKIQTLIEETYAHLSPWQLVQVSRHPNRPHTRDFVDALFEDFMELHGDRCFSDDQAILGGTALWNLGSEIGKIPVMIIGHQKGRNTRQKMERNFGMARPEGYRKAMRLMDLANRSRMPIITFIDTPGAYPGLDAEERGQSQAIAESIQTMFGLSVPVLSIVIGEGGSGGALAIGIADRVLMMGHTTYSVISPESCASILWNDSTLAEKAAQKLKMSAKELFDMGIIDGVIPEPLGGAHRDWAQSFGLVKKSIVKNFVPIVKTFLKSGKKSTTQTKLMKDRLTKFRKMGEFALAHAPNPKEERTH
jgi:acetyl-CoA carboxylase carboxyl transferase subunit alpha